MATAGAMPSTSSSTLNHVRSPIELMQHMVAGTAKGLASPTSQSSHSKMQAEMDAKRWQATMMNGGGVAMIGPTPSMGPAPPMGNPMMGMPRPGMYRPPMPMPPGAIPPGHHFPPGHMLPPPNGHPMPPEAMRGMPGPPPTLPQIPTPAPLEYRIHDINRRLYIFNNSGINERDHQQWWDAFAHEFFDDDAKISFHMFDEAAQKPERYTIGRALIPRYFRSIFESGVRELYYVIRSPSVERASALGPVFECENMLVVNRQDRPQSEVHTDCRFTMEFAGFDEMYSYRIRHWIIDMRSTHEYLFNEQTKEYENCPVDPEKPKTPIARCGMPAMTLQYLKLCSILEPMQMLMSFTKGNNCTPPREMLRTVTFQHFNKNIEMNRQMAAHAHMAHSSTGMLPQHDEKPKAPRKRQRKPPANPKTKKTTTLSPAPSNSNFPPNSMQGGNFPPMGYQDVMVVGEPSMMGGEFGEEDERTISRVENTQYDPNALAMQQQVQHMQALPPSTQPGAGQPPMSLPNNSMMPPNMVMGPPGMPNGHVGPTPPQGFTGFDYSQPTWRPPSSTPLITG